MDSCTKKVPVNRITAKNLRLTLLLRNGDTEEVYQKAQFVFSTVSSGLPGSTPPPPMIMDQLSRGLINVC